MTISTFRLFTALALTLACLATPTAYADSEPTNFAKISKGIYRGARPDSPDQMAYLAHTAKIKTIINLQGGDLNTKFGRFIPLVEPGETPEEIEAEGTMARSAHIKEYISLPLTALTKEVSPEEMDRLHEILQIMNDPAKQPVYVHCAQGIDRTGLVTALYRVIYQNRRPQDAYAEMRDNGHDFTHTLFTFGLDRAFFDIVDDLKGHESESD